MGKMLEDSWESAYLKKADKFEKICLKEDRVGYEHDLQASSLPAEYACSFLKKTSIYSKGLSVFFFLILLLAHHTSEYSVTSVKSEEGYFERIYPVKVNK